MLHFLFWLFLFLSASSSNAIEISTSKSFAIFPPLLSHENGQLKGHLIDSIRCGFRDIEKDVEISVSPWKRVQYNYKQKKLHGYFPAFASKETPRKTGSPRLYSTHTSDKETSPLIAGISTACGLSAKSGTSSIISKILLLPRCNKRRLPPERRKGARDQRRRNRLVQS